MNGQNVFDALYSEELYLIPPGTIILLDREWQEHSEDEKTLLQKILGSVKLGLPQVRIIYRPETNLDELAASNTEKVIAFGTRINPEINFYEPFSSNGFSIICAHGLSALDDSRKKNLWLALRKLYNV